MFSLKLKKAASINMFIAMYTWICTYIC